MEHSFIDLIAVGLTGLTDSQAVFVRGSVLTNKAEREEPLNINPVICLQGPGSWRGQWAEGLHVDLRHRLPPGGSLLWLFCDWADRQVGRGGARPDSR